jgi:acyl-CoA synthetase (AMP-forming)/AMP-acid ligase II
MTEHWLLARLGNWPGQPALIWNDQPFTYQWLQERAEQWQQELLERGVKPGQVIALEADYSPEACALLLALIVHDNIVAPLSSITPEQKGRFLEIAQVEGVFTWDGEGRWLYSPRTETVSHPLLLTLRAAGAAGLVLFSSGSTGDPKAALHNFDLLLEKFQEQRRGSITLAFLLLDHIGGLNTLFHTLANGGTLVTIAGRDPAAVCRAVERHEVRVLPTSPTFLNLLLMSELHREYNLSSLELITYGTEVMPASTLVQLNRIFPGTRFLQTYGLSEVGILRTRSRDSQSLWVKVGGEGYETKVVDGILWIKARFAMLGYLNAPSPFDADGWFNTDDEVEVDGEYLRILGRRSEIINVGGQKVYPAEVESVLLQMDNVEDVVVLGEKNPLLGQVVVARINCGHEEDPRELKQRVRDFCRGKLEPYKIPVRVEVAQSRQYSQRFKHLRRQGAQYAA